MKLIDRDQITYPLVRADIKISELSLEDIGGIIRTWQEEKSDIWTEFDIKVVGDNVVLFVTFDDEWDMKEFGRRFVNLRG